LVNGIEWGYITCTLRNIYTGTWENITHISYEMSLQAIVRGTFCTVRSTDISEMIEDKISYH